jgi:glycosyltransferase involved in cell wall biosynthesis
MVKLVRYYPRAAVGDGGMTKAIRRWSEAMAELGAEVKIVYDQGTAPSSNGVEWVHARHVGKGQTLMPRDLADHLDGADLLVLHSGWTLRNTRAAAVARDLGVPYMLEPRGALDPHILGRKRLLKQAWWHASERRLVTEARAIHIFFEEERAHLDAVGYRGHVVVAPNGVDVPEEHGWNGSGDYILWLGRFDPEHKGLDVLLRAIHLDPSAVSLVRLLGPDWRDKKREVRAMVRDLGLEGHVTVEEPIHGEAKREALQECKGFVYPSRWDACPNSVLEAVAHGVPTLVTPYPLGTYLASRRGAILARAEERDLARGLYQLASGTAASVGGSGAQIARRELTWNAVAKSWLDQVARCL